MRPATTSAPPSSSALETASAPLQPAEHGKTRGPCSARGGPSDSVWRPVVTKTLSVAAAMLGLAAIGTVSSLHDARGGLDGNGATSSASSAQRASLLQATDALFNGSSAASTEQVLKSEATRAEVMNGSGSASASTSAPPTGSAPPVGPNNPSGVTADGKVILNTANAEELDRLPGIGKKTAERILELRARLGRFKKVQDLLRVKGIGAKSLQKLMPLIVLDPA